MNETVFSEASVPDQSGRTVLITGANTGLGHETARVLAAKNARVLLACRSTDKGRSARDRILALHPNADIEVVQLDLGSLESIREAADQIRAEPRLDLIINNAGIMYPPHEETADGFESQFGVNHLGHFALTGRLMDEVRATPGARVVTVSSQGHRMRGGEIDFDDVHAEKSYSRQKRYNMSKLANLLFTYELQRRLAAAGKDTLAVAAHPGWTETNLQEHAKAVKFLNRFLAQEPLMGALPTLYAATQSDVNGAEYYGPSGFMEMNGPPKRVKSNRRSHDRNIAERLWNVSEDLTGVRFQI